MSQVVRLARLRLVWCQKSGLSPEWQGWSAKGLALRQWEKLWDWTKVVRDARWSAYGGGRYTVL